MDSHRLLVVCSGGSREEDRGTVTVLDARRAEIFCKFSLPPPSPRPPIISGSGSASMTLKALSGRSRS